MLKTLPKMPSIRARIEKIEKYSHVIPLSTSEAHIRNAREPNVPPINITIKATNNTI